MKKIILVLFTLGTFIIPSGLRAQTTSLEAKAQQFANEVYQDCPQYAQAEYLNDYVTMIGRVEITTLAEYGSADYQLLSSIPLKNKCNTALTYDSAENFNPENFNPLKYFFNFYSQTDQAYLVDNTQYIVLIHHAQ